MAQVYRLYPDTYSTQTLAINAATYVESTEIDNSTGLWDGLWGELTADFGAGPAATGWLHIALYDKKVDGTNAEDEIPQVYQQNVVASLKVRATDTTQIWAFHVPKIPPTKFVLSYYNGSGTTTAETTELKIMLYTTEIAAA
jgi:hypothetical protein